MASTKTPAKTTPAKRPAKATEVTAAKAKPVPKAKVAAKPAPAAKPKPAPKAAPKSTPKDAGAKPAGVRAKKRAGVPAEQRRNYIEMAAYYIAERRGFAPGNPLEDWVQAEAEIDRLLAEGRLGG
jgi:hypothetical protein